MTNSDYLTMAENRFASVQRYFPDSPESTRLANVIHSMSLEMAPEELDLHNTKKIETPVAKTARLQEEQRLMKQMEMNKDNNSI